MSKKHKKRRGHFCWCCGRGHAHHLCRDCAALGKAELNYRQAVRNLERNVTFEGIIGRKRCKSFEKFLSHPDERIRKYAEYLAAEDVKARAFLRELEREREEYELEGCEFDMDYTCENEQGGTITSQTHEIEDISDDDIPF